MPPDGSSSTGRLSFKKNTSAGVKGSIDVAPDAALMQQKLESSLPYLLSHPVALRLRSNTHAHAHTHLINSWLRRNKTVFLRGGRFNTCEILHIGEFSTQMTLTVLGLGEGQLFRQTTQACHNSEASVAQPADQPL